MLFWKYIFLPAVLSANALDRIDTYAYIEECRHNTGPTDLSWRMELKDPDEDPDVVSARVFAISSIHAITVKEVVTTTNRYGIEIVKPMDKIKVQMTRGKEIFTTHIKHVLLPERESDNTFQSIAILELADQLPKNTQHLCVSELMSWSFEEVTHVEDTSRVRPTFEDHTCNAEYCKVATSLHSAFVKADGAKLIAIGVNTTHVINMARWSHFICSNTGACVEKHLSLPMEATPTILDGKINKMKNVDGLRQIMINSVAITRLNPVENRWLKNTCGQSSSFLVNILVRFYSPHACSEFAPANCKPEGENEAKLKKCKGAFISHLHIMTSSACLKRLGGSSKPFIIQYQFSEDVTKEEEVVRLVVPWLGAESDDSIAILEMANPFQGTDSGPVCMPSNSHLIPEYLYAAYLTDTDLLKVQMMWKENCDSDCQHVQLNMKVLYDEDHFGTPLVEVSPLYDGDVDYEDERFILHAVYTWSRRQVGFAVLIDPFRTYICVYTGICDEDEQFEESRMYLPHPLELFSGASCSHLNHVYKSITSCHLWSDYNDALRKSNSRILEMRRLRPLNDKERDGNRASCGKSWNSDLLVIQIGTVIDSQYSFPGYEKEKEKITMSCSGVLISMKHVLTDRQCAMSNLQSTSVVFMNTPLAEGIWQRTRVGVRHFVFPGRHNLDSWNGIAILELNHRIPKEWYSAIVCLGNNDMKFTNMDLLNPADLEKGQTRTTVGRRDLKGTTMWDQNSQMHLFEWHGSNDKFKKVEGSHQRGSPLIGKGVDGKVYVLGLSTEYGWKTTKFIPLFPYMNDISRMTGVIEAVAKESHAKRWTVDEFIGDAHEIYEKHGTKIEEVC